ncbi:MAG: peptidylprolyl isomerase [Bacteroidales bacterium]|nr:peptidylprolyl isomerase [Bacteroidales bacterium]
MRKAYLLIVLSICAFQLQAQSSFNHKTVAEINGKKISVGSLLNAYEKNEKADSTTSLPQYLELYINYKLKVMEAEALKMDTLRSFKKELSRYRKQLERPYFENRKVLDSLVKQAWEREQYDVRVSHILIRVAPDAPAKDTLDAWNRIMKIRNEILNGVSFAKAAEKYSEDPSAKDQKGIPGKSRPRRGNHGDLGYFSVFSMVYPFENAAYETPVGQISMPVRTKYGYHLIKVTDKRPAMGIAQVEHIFVALPPGSSKADSLAKAKKIQTIDQKIESGLSFEQAARQFSEDKGSSFVGGKLPAFSSNRIVPEFVQAVDTLKTGEISKPFQTIYGFHIIKLLNRKKPGSFKEEEDQIRQKIASSDRKEIARQVLIKELTKQYRVRIYQKSKQHIFSLINNNPILPYNLMDKTDSAAILVKMGTKYPETYNAGDFVWFVRSYQQKLKKPAKKIDLEKLFQNFLKQKILSYHIAHLEQENPEFKALMQEYHDGILLFNLTNIKVWDKAASDTAGLKSYFAQNRMNYMQRPGVQAIQFEVPVQMESNMKELTAQYPEGRLLKQAIQTGKIKNSNKIKIISDVYHRGDNPVLDHLEWKTGWQSTKLNNNVVDFVYISTVLKNRPKSYHEALGQVISDYQDVLEKQWVKELRQKYPVHINKEVMKRVIKKYNKKNRK